MNIGRKYTFRNITIGLNYIYVYLLYAFFYFIKLRLNNFLATQITLLYSYLISFFKLLMQRIIQNNIDKYQTFKSKCGFHYKNNLFTIRIMTYVLLPEITYYKNKKTL